MELELTDGDLQSLTEKLSRDVREKQTKIQALKVEIEGIQADIQRERQVRSDFTMQLLSADEASPLVEQYLQVKENLERKQKDFEAVTKGTSQDFEEVKKLERKLCELESGSKLEEMEALNKENLASINEMKSTHELKLREHKELEEKLTQLQGRMSELHRQQAHRTTGSSTAQSMDAKLDRFIRKTCLEAGLELYSNTTAKKQS